MDELRADPSAGLAGEPGEPAEAASGELLSLVDISKSFFGVEVLHEVSLSIRSGEVHAVVGENGAGKSTLMKIVAGAYHPDGGTVVLDGDPVRFTHPIQAQHAGISIIYQEFNLLPDRTVAQNIFIGREPRRGPIIDKARLEEDTATLLDELRVGDVISPRSLIRDLSVAQQQMVEIAKALSFDARILIMDEPTASLAPAEIAPLFERVRLLCERGLAVFYISHRLNEVFELATRVSVLKDGRHVGTVSPDEVSTAELVKMMVGRDFEHYFPGKAEPDDLGATRLRVSGGGNERLSGIDLELRAGEIVGVAGLEGSGRTELAEALFGVRPFTHGALELDGRPVTIRSPRSAISHGIGFITEDRKGQGLILPRSVQDNALLPLRSLGRARRAEAGTVPAKDLRAVAEDLARKVDLRAAGLEQEVQYLSGGNQQKVVLAKWLATDAAVLLFDEPTRGIDVGAKAGIHELMRDLARRGAAILMISSELPEIIGMSDRIAVMRRGRIAGELGADATETDIMLLATGAGEPGELARARAADPASEPQAPAAGAGAGRPQREEGP